MLQPDRTESLRILKALAEGVHPFTGDRLPHENINPPTYFVPYSLLFTRSSMRRAKESFLRTPDSRDGR